MANLWKPMLAAKPDPKELDATLEKLFTLGRTWLASPKLDGIRVTVQNGRLYSRSLKLIPNKAMQQLWGREELDGLDGEVIVGSPTAEDCFNRSTSVVMSRDKPADDATFNIFDCYDEMEPFEIRLSNATSTADQRPFMNLAGNHSTTERFIRRVPHTVIKTLEQLASYEGKQTGLGHEGIMLRDPIGAYKHGRSTVKEGGLIAVKRFVDAEAVVIGTYEQMENTNQRVVNELGKMKRSSHKAGKVGKGTLGGFTVRPLACACEACLRDRSEACLRQFSIGTGQGLTDAVRLELWKKRNTLPGKIIKFRYQLIGTKDAPRQPIFLGWRDPRDL